MKQFEKVNSDSQLSGIIRSTPEDFMVDELSRFAPSGQGEHVWLHIRKSGENTDWVAGQLAKIAGVMRRDVSFAGMKDRHAITTQWFSVQMPGRDAPNWQANLPESIQILDEKRHDRKLRRGALDGNRFAITIKEFKGTESELKSTLERIIKQGIPNYYGEQRFGHYSEAHGCGFNIHKAEQWFKGDFKVKGRQKRSIYLSAARSWIFNHVLSERVRNGSWNQALEGDIFMLDGSRSSFSEKPDAAIIKRLKEQDIHPTGVLWGRGKVLSEGVVAELENEVANQFKTLCEGLERNGLKQERKALRLRVEDLDYTFNSPESITINFSLPAGAYATSLLSEIGDFSQAGGH